ncbi:hypothetical protein L596_011844 [Steinernema carpocapsae]|uniref:Glycoprotein-N-acetylgalactosamine 3-beta-galactosyltransferase 1 n=1 Tax=Steinernema carpocapsae TaxID=34508 RepID=A0A4U5NV84_STECR|nr:hypothetical protein L596_011844 [Steinernema carpocapsae]
MFKNRSSSAEWHEDRNTDSATLTTTSASTMISRRSRFTSFCLGFILGITMTLLLLNVYFYNATPSATSLEPVVHDNYATREPHELRPHESRVEHTEPEDAELKTEMRKNVRILCWIMTTSANTYNKAMHVNATWASRCNKHIFFSANESSGLPSVKLNISDGRNYLWWKTKEAFKYLYENELDNYDYFLKADDDTYVIVENLRLMLMPYSPEDPLYFGCRFKPFTKQGYMSGGAGYILSREGLRRFVEDSNPKNCKAANTGAEDAEMGKCLDKVGVKAVDTRDSLGRHRMLPFSPTPTFRPTSVFQGGSLHTCTTPTTRNSTLVSAAAITWSPSTTCLLRRCRLWTTSSTA